MLTDDTNTLIRAVMVGDVERAAQLLDDGVDPDALDSEGGTALHYAVALGNLAMVRCPVARGADVNLPREELRWGEPGPLHGVTPLMTVAGSFYDDIMEFLLRAGATLDIRDHLGRTALFHALGQPERLKRLIDAGAELDARAHDDTTAMLQAMLEENSEAIEVLTSAGASATGAKEVQLLQAAAAGDLELVRILVSAGVDVNFRHGSTALSSAAGKGDLAMVDFLLSVGADPNRLDSANPGGDLGPLSRAVYAGELETVRLLLQAGANVGAENAGTSVLDYARLGEAEGRRKSAPWQEIIALVREALRKRGCVTLALQKPVSGEARTFLDALAPHLPVTHFRSVSALGTLLIESDEIPFEAASACWVKVLVPARQMGWSCFLTTRAFDLTVPTREKLEMQVAAIKEFSIEQWLKGRLARRERDAWDEQLAQLDAQQLAEMREKATRQYGSASSVRFVLLMGPPTLAPLLYAFGGWNTTPPPIVQSQMLRRWHERHGAELQLLGGDILQVHVRQPLEPQAVKEVAKEIGLFCWDGTDDTGPWEHAQMASSSSWHFWWD